MPADVRLLRTVAFAVEEAILTGESVAVTKRAEALPRPSSSNSSAPPPLGDRKNMAFFGCLASRGLVNVDSCTVKWRMYTHDIIYTLQAGGGGGDGDGHGHGAGAHRAVHRVRGWGTCQ